MRKASLTSIRGLHRYLTEAPRDFAGPGQRGPVAQAIFEEIPQHDIQYYVEGNIMPCITYRSKLAILSLLTEAGSSRKETVFDNVVFFKLDASLATDPR